MIKNPFRKTPIPTPNFNIQIQELQNRINELEKQAFDLHCRITSERHIPTKENLIAKRADTLQQISMLKTKQDTPKEEQASTQIDKLFRETLFILELNGHRTKPDKDLNITLSFYPCKHTKTIHVKNFIHPKSIPETHFQRSLLANWHGILRKGTIFEGKFNCKQCREAIEKRRAKTGTHKDTPIGTCTFILKVP